MADLLAEGAGLHTRPFPMDDRARVADQLARQVPNGRGRKELGRLDLLCHRERLELRSSPRSVIGFEGEEHDEPERHGEPRRQHAEHARGAVAVVEVAPSGVVRRVSNIPATAIPVAAAIIRTAQTRFIDNPIRFRFLACPADLRIRVKASG
jgi:hypothetical protein